MFVQEYTPIIQRNYYSCNIVVRLEDKKQKLVAMQEFSYDTEIVRDLIQQIKEIGTAIQEKTEIGTTISKNVSNLFITQHGQGQSKRFVRKFFHSERSVKIEQATLNYYAELHKIYCKVHLSELGYNSNYHLNLQNVASQMKELLVRESNERKYQKAFRAKVLFAGGLIAASMITRVGKLAIVGTIFMISTIAFDLLRSVVKCFDKSTKKEAAEILEQIQKLGSMCIIHAPVDTTKYRFPFNQNGSNPDSSESGNGFEVPSSLYPDCKNLQAASFSYPPSDSIYPPNSSNPTPLAPPPPEANPILPNPSSDYYYYYTKFTTPSAPVEFNNGTHT